MANFLDIVNEDDKIVGKATFKEAHQQNLLHRFTRILVVNNDGDFVLHTRPPHYTDAHKLDSAGGHVEFGESYINGALRELEEEMGITVSADDLNLLGNIRYKNLESPYPENMIGQAFFVKHNGPYTAQVEEVGENWVTISPKELEDTINKNNSKISRKVIASFKHWNHIK